MNLVNGDGSGGRGGHGGPSDRGGHGGTPRCQEEGQFKRDCPQVQAPLAGGNGNCLNFNEQTEMESASILTNLVNDDGSGGRGGHGGPSDRAGHQEKVHFKRDCPQAEASLAAGNRSCFDSDKLTEMESPPILMNLVNGGHGGPSDRGGHGGTFKRDCPQIQAPPAGGNGNGLYSNEVAETEYASILMNLVNGDGSGGRGGHGGPSDRGGHGGTPRGGRMSKFWAATSKYLGTPQ